MQARRSLLLLASISLFGCTGIIGEEGLDTTDDVAGSEVQPPPRSVAPVARGAAVDTVVDDASAQPDHRPACPSAPRFEALHLEYVEEQADRIETMSITPRDTGFYDFYGYAHGLLSMAEGTADVERMRVAIAYFDNMLDAASDMTGDGIADWAPISPSGKPYTLYMFQGATGLARAAAVIMREPAFRAVFEETAARYIAFVDESIVRYWYFDEWGETIPWLPTDLGGWGTYTTWSDKLSLWAINITYLYRATGDPFYEDLARRIATGFRRILTADGDAIVWNVGEIPIGHGGNPEGTPDTSHTNREAMMVTAMHEAGIEFTLEDLRGFGHTLTDNIWNGSREDPHFHNYISGANGPYRSSGPYDVGRITTGWAMLGRYSEQAQQVLADAMDAFAAGNRNPSLARAAYQGKVALSGHLVLNQRRCAW